ncbi:MAG: phosphoribosylanthranilate isomerase [Bacteroidia bacterium]|nr:phosphoribosylanthranilate isomerase [Bacteroidia bacterium]
MPLKLKIKICGITNTEQLSEIQNLSPDYCGFIFYEKSKRFFRGEFIPSLKAGILKTGVFVNPEPGYLTDTVNRFGLDAVQFHGHEPSSLCEKIKLLGKIVIKAFGIETKKDFDATLRYHSFCDYFLFDKKDQSFGGTGKTFDWKLLSYYRGTVPFFLSGGIGPENLADAFKIGHPQLFGVDLNSRWELSPGIKNIKLLKNHLLNLKT